MTLDMELRNFKTGERVRVDVIKARMARLRRRIVNWSNLNSTIYDRNKQRLVMIGLSYRPGVKWEANHIRDYLQKLRKKAGDGLISYAWVAELHKSGIVHYHLYVVVVRGTDVPTPDNSGMWPHGDSNIQTGKSPYYLVVYLSKDYQKDFGLMSQTYKGMRAFAVWVNKSFFGVTNYWRFRLTALPMWLEKLISPIQDWEGLYPSRVPGVGWQLIIPRHLRRGKPYRPIEVFTSDWVIDSF